MSLAWKPSGPISFHQSMNFGCHASSARCRRRSPDRLTLFGIFSSVTTLDIDQVLFQLKVGRSGRPYSDSAPVGPVELGRVKIQFCQADSRPKILVSSVSGPTKRSDASMPVS